MSDNNILSFACCGMGSYLNWALKSALYPLSLVLKLLLVILLSSDISIKCARKVKFHCGHIFLSTS